MGEGSQPAKSDGQVQRWQPPKPPARKSGQKGVMMVAGAVLVTLAAAGSASIALFDVTRVHLGYDAAKAAYLKEGLPWSAEDLRQKPAVPDEQNAGPELLQLLLEYAKIKGAQPAEFVTPDTADKVRLHLATRSPLLDRAKAVLKAKGGLDFKRDWNQGAALAFSELAPMKSIVRDLCLRAELCAMQGNTQEALSDLASASDMAIRAHADQVLISALVSNACRTIVCRSVRLIAGGRLQDPDFLRRLEETIRPLEAEMEHEGILRSEAYTHLWALRNLKRIGGLGGLMLTGQGEAPPPDPSPFADKVDVSGVAERSMAVKSFEFWTEVAKEAKHRPEDPIHLFDCLDRQAIEAERSGSSSMAHMKIMLPVFSQAGPALVKHEAVVKATRALLLAWAERAEGKKPSRLNQVAGGPWTDPFSDEEFRAKFERDKVLIWSVGKDGKDQGGAPDTTRHLDVPKRSSEGDDVAVQIPDLSLLKKK